MRKYRLLLWGLVLILTVFQAAFAKNEDDAGKFKLRFHPAEGAVYAEKEIMELNLSMEANGVKMGMDLNMGVGYTFHVEKVEKNGASWSRMNFNSIYMSVAMLGNETVYDSTDIFAPASPLMMSAGGMVGEGIRLKINEKGELKKVEGLKEMARSVAGRMTVSDERFRKEMERTLYKEFKKSMKSPVDRVVGLYPPQPVAVGESWRSTSKLSSANFEVEMENVYTLTECSNGVATVAINSPLKSKASAELSGGGKLEFTSGRMVGIVRMDLKTGWINRVDLKLEFQGNAESQGTQMPLTITGKVMVLPFEAEV